MPIFLEGNPRYTPANVTGTTDHLKGNIFQTIVVEFDIRVETFITASTDNTITFLNPNFQTDDYIKDDSSSRFANFNVGDTIEVVGTSSNNATYLISEKPNNGTIRVTDSGGSPVTLTSEVAAAGTIRLAQEPKAITFDYGLIENSEAVNFNSKVDGSLQRYSYSVSSGSIGTSYANMIALGLESWKLGSARAKAGTHDTTLKRYYFTIEQTFIINPFYLSTQRNLLLTDHAPNYFALYKCLKHAFRCRAYRTFNDPNVYQELVVSNINGDTGWFNENYNGLPTIFSIIDAPSTLEIFTNDIQTIEFTIDTTGAAAEYVRLAIVTLPEDSDDQATGTRNIQQNYLFDYADATVGGGSVVGSQDGTIYQVIDSFIAVAGTGSQVDCTVVFDLGSEVVSRIAGYTNKEFLLVVSVVSDSQTAQAADYTTLKIGVGTYTNVLAAPTADVYLFSHEINAFDVANATEVTDICLEDELVAYTQLNVAESTVLTSVTQSIIATNGTDEVVLESRTTDFASLPTVGGYPFLNESNYTPYNVISTELRATYKEFRDVANDSSGYIAYAFQYPFMIRWEYWEQLILSSLPSAFLDTTEPFNGYNNDWHRIDSLSGWSIKYKIEGTISDGVYTDTFEFADITRVIRTYDENTDWDATIETYEGATLLDSSGTPYIEPNAFTKIKADFEWLGAGTVNYNNYYMVVRVIDKETGGYIINNSFSSEYNREPISYLWSTDGTSVGNGKIAITQAGSVITGICYINPNKFNPSGVEVTISARLAVRTVEPAPVEAIGRLWQDGNTMLWQDNNRAIWQG